MKERHVDVSLFRRMRRAGMILLTVTGVNLVIVGAKLFVYLTTLSIAALAYMLDTLIDITNDMVLFIALSRASKPPDADHPYGHGKYEAIGRVFVGCALIVTGLHVALEGIKRVMSGEPIVASGLASLSSALCSSSISP